MNNFEAGIHIEWADVMLDFPIWEGMSTDFNQQQIVFNRNITYVFENNIVQNGCNFQYQSQIQGETDLITTDIQKIKMECDIKVDASHSIENQKPQKFKMEVEQIQNLINYNADLALIEKYSNQKVNSNNRILDIFLPKFKHFLKTHLRKKNFSFSCISDKKLKQLLNHLPGMEKLKNMKVLEELLNLKQICGININMLDIITQYITGDISLLDAFFPLENEDGTLRKNKLQKKSTKKFTQFLTIYEMMIKIHNTSKQPIQLDKSFQNLWYYSHTTTQKYQPFFVNQ